MKLLQWFLSLFMKHKDKLPDDMDTVGELKGKAGDLMKKHGDKLDDIADRIPGDADDKIIDQAKDALK